MTGPTPYQRRQIERLLDKGADLPDLDWDAMTADDVARALLKATSRYAKANADKVSAQRLARYRTGQPGSNIQYERPR